MMETTWSINHQAHARLSSHNNIKHVGKKLSTLIVYIYIFISNNNNNNTKENVFL
jgi:hypothetical protein